MAVTRMTKMVFHSILQARVIWTSLSNIQTIANVASGTSRFVLSPAPSACRRLPEVFFGVRKPEIRGSLMELCGKVGVPHTGSRLAGLEKERVGLDDASWRLG